MICHILHQSILSLVAYCDITVTEFLFFFFFFFWHYVKWRTKFISFLRRAVQNEHQTDFVLFFFISAGRSGSMSFPKVLACISVDTHEKQFNNFISPWVINVQLLMKAWRLVIKLSGKQPASFPCHCDKHSLNHSFIIALLGCLLCYMKTV